MGLITWILVAVVILAVIGLGWQAFFSGVVDGVKKVGDNPLVDKIRDEADKVLSDRVITKNMQ